jgi:hypothetical protein
MAAVFEDAFEELLGRVPYSVPQLERESILLQGLNDLSRRHSTSCEEYDRIIRGFWSGQPEVLSVADVPYLPVSLFKTQRLLSVPKDSVRVALTSSGTTGQSVSWIGVDADTSVRQQRALASSLGFVLGPKRLPMLVLDTAAVFKDPRSMSARGAGVLGIMRYGREHVFALDDSSAPDITAVRGFLERYGSAPFFMFGFTFMAWLQFYERFKGEGFDLSRGTLIHSGGWKKMVDRAVTPEVFRHSFRRDFGLERIFNFYGMVEQIGSIFLEGDDGLLYPPNFADVIVRDPVTWKPNPVGVPGVIQVLSVLPGSYPGHSLLTEDLGVIESVDSGIGGRMGKGIRIVGRIPKSELRGCSDVIGAQAA